MPNQYTKIHLFIENDFSIDNTDFIEPLSTVVIDILKDALPKDIEFIDTLIDKIKIEL